MEFSCFLHDPVNVGNLISSSSAFLKPSLYIWKFLVHVLLKPRLKDFERYFASMYNECSCVVVCTFFGIALLWDCNENWPFPVLWPLLSFPHLLTYWVHVCVYMYIGIAEELMLLNSDAFALSCWRRLLRVHWTARISSQSILEEVNPEYSLEGLMLKLKLQYFGHLMWRANSLEKTQNAWKDRRQEQRVTEDEMVGWYHQCNGH